MTPEEKAQDDYLRRKFGKSCAWYEQTLKEQNFGCAICSKPVVAYALNVDHMHAFDTCKIRTKKVAGGRMAFATDPFGVPADAFGKTAPQAIKKVEMILRERSVRGLLCMKCNRGIGFFAIWILGHYTESADLINKAAAYVRNWLVAKGTLQQRS